MTTAEWVVLALVVAWVYWIAAKWLARRIKKLAEEFEEMP